MMPSGQTTSGASRGGSGVERLVAGEHLPDRFGEPAGDVDLGDLGAALLAQAALGLLVALGESVVAQRVHGGLQQRPAQVLGAVLGQMAAAVALAGLVDLRTQAATSFLGAAKRSMSPISEAMVKASTQPIPGTLSSSGM